MPIVIESSSDTANEVAAALNATPEKPETPVVEAPPAETPEEEGTPEAEGQPEVEGEEQPAPKAARPPTHVPFSRLSEVVHQRDAERKTREALEREVAALKAARPVEVVPEVHAGTYSGLVEPTIEQFQSDPEKYPDPYAAYAKASGKFEAAELRAKEKFEEQETAKANEEEAVEAAFVEAEVAVLERIPDYETVITNSKAELSKLMDHMIKRSEYGPDLRYHLAKNPKESARITKLPLALQGPAIGRLEAKIELDLAAAQAALETGEEEATPVTPKPKQKPVSKAPAPINPLRPSAPPKSLQQMAGPTDRAGVDINFSKDYAKNRQPSFR